MFLLIKISEVLDATRKIIKLAPLLLLRIESFWMKESRKRISTKLSWKNVCMIKGDDFVTNIWYWIIIYFNH